MRTLVLAAVSLRWVTSLCVAMGIMAWRFWLGSLDSPYVIFMTSSTAAVVVSGGAARRPWLLRSGISGPQNSVLTSAGRTSAPGVDTVSPASQPRNSRSGELLSQVRPCCHQSICSQEVNHFTCDDVTTRMNLEDIMLSEISQSQKDQRRRTPLRWSVKAVTLTEAESRMRLPGAERGRNGELLFDRHKISIAQGE